LPPKKNLKSVRPSSRNFVSLGGKDIFKYIAAFLKPLLKEVFKNEIDFI
jgi:hypothetical protein